MAFSNKRDSHCVFKNKRLRNVMPQIFKFPRKESYSFINSFYVVLENIGFLKLNLIAFFYFILFLPFLDLCMSSPWCCSDFFECSERNNQVLWGFFFFLQTKQWNFNIINSLKKEENSQFKIKFLIIPIPGV